MQNLKYLILCLFIILKFVLQYLLIDDIYDLQRDEYLHLDQANHLALGYLSVPPFTSWISWLIKILGNSVFWVKFFPALFGALTIIVVWKTIEELKGGLFAQVLAATVLTFSVILRINILFQPNSADILFWTLCYYHFFKFLKTKNTKNNISLLYLGLFFGIAFLNKYNIAFWALGIFPALLITENRKIFLNKYLYFSALIALIIIFPNLIWQYQNNFPVIWHMKTLAATQLVNINRFDFIKEQFLFFFGGLPVLFAAFYAFFVYKPFQNYRIIGLSFLFTILFFIYFKAKAYYALGLYPIFFAFGSVYLENILSQGWKRNLRFVLPTMIILLFVPLIRIIFPILKPIEIQEKLETFKSLGLLRWEDGKDHSMPQDFADMLSWRELAEKVDKEYTKLDPKEHNLVLCDNYGQAGAINFYSKFPNIRAVSVNADYINWFPLEKPIKNLILVEDNNDDDVKRTKEQPLFESIILADSLTNKYAREFGTRIFVLKNATQDINKILQSDIAEEKATQ